jgi:hypothetical protein
MSLRHCQGNFGEVAVKSPEDRLGFRVAEKRFFLGILQIEQTG